jgi:catechol 2,3-dioxygenase-like lactoylglutathione lyase family enzyme
MPRARPGLLTSTPLFVVSDLHRAIAFYVGKLGFQEPQRLWGDPPCFAMLHRDAFEIMLSLAEKPDHVRPNGPNGIWDVYFRVPSLDAEVKALEASGAVLARQPETTEYDMIEAEVLDPDGYRICFGQDTGPDLA